MKNLKNHYFYSTYQHRKLLIRNSGLKCGMSDSIFVHRQMCTEMNLMVLPIFKTICTCVNGIYLVFLLKDILVTTIETNCLWVLHELDTGSTCIFIFQTGHHWHCLEEIFRETEDKWNQSLLLPQSFSFYVYALNVNWTPRPKIR